jgi:hypothetical protein
MSSPTRRILLSAAFMAFTGAALAQPGYPPIPPPRPEPVPPPPGATYIWRPGHWVWNGATYVWAPGRYVVRQPHWHEYVPGGWVMRHGQWVWVEPHWR